MIIISGISDKEHAQGLIRLGAFEFLLKPFRLEVVEKTVKRAVEHRRRTLAASRDSGVRIQDAEEATEWKIVKDNR